MKILAFTGMPFSGKSEAVKIAKEMGISVIRMGDMIWAETKKQGFEINDHNVGHVANDMRKMHGMDVWAIKTLEKIKTMENVSLLVIDGVRNIEEVETFEKELGKDFILVALEVPNETRYRRAMTRGREDDSQDINLVKKRDKRELSWNLDNVIASADIVVSNEGSIGGFQEKIKKMLHEFLKR